MSAPITVKGGTLGTLSVQHNQPVHFSQARSTPYSSDSEIEEAQTVSLGSNRFQLIGVAEFLDVEGLLDQFQRADFTARESVNSTGQLKAQHKLLIKGLYIQDADPSRINITSVIVLADSCS